MSCPICQSSSEVFHQYIEPTYGERIFENCSQCGLVFLKRELLWDVDKEKDRYLQHNNDPSDERYIQFLSQVTTPLQRFLKPNSVGLDFGCGPGPAIAQIMQKAGFQTLNFDPYFFPESTLLDQTFDFLTVTEVVEHFHEPLSSFHRMNQLLKKGGVIGLMTNLLYDSISFDSWWYHRDPTHVAFYRPQTLQWLAKEMHWSEIFQANNVVIYRKMS